MDAPPAQSTAPVSGAFACLSMSVNDTLTLGRLVGEYAGAGLVLALNGPLGSGKTHFTKGIAQGMGVAEHTRVNSPTFTLLRSYKGAKLTLHHADLYRLESAADVPHEILEAIEAPGAVTVIEWADKFSDLLPQAAPCLDITFEHTGGDSRRLTCNARGCDIGPLVAALSRIAVHAEESGRTPELLSRLRAQGGMSHLEEHGGQAPRRIVIIGGGISGLAAAYELSKAARHGAPVSVTLIEASDWLGGVIQTTRRDGFVLEHGPDSFVTYKPQALALARELGLEGRVIGTNEAHRRSFIVRNGRLVALPQGFFLLAPMSLGALVKTDVISTAGKMRMALELFVPPAVNGHDESLASFVRRRFGEEALERIAQPIVGGIYTADPEHLSLAATFPQFLEMEREQGSVIRALSRKRRAGQAAGESAAAGPRYGMFASFKNGMSELVDALVSRLAPGTVMRGARAQALRRVGGTWHMDVDGRRPIEADAVMLALPAHGAAALLRDETPALASALDDIRYASTATVNLAFARHSVAHALDGMGFVAPAVENRRVLACTFSSVKFAGRAPDGVVLLRAFIGGALHEDMLAHDDRELIAMALDELRALLGIRGEPLLADVTRWNRAMPQYDVGHVARAERIQKMARTVPGLTLLGNAFDGIGIPDCIRRATEAAKATTQQDRAYESHR